MVITGETREDYVKRIDREIEESSVPMFKRFRLYSAGEAWWEEQDKINKLCPDGYSVVVMIDDNNAIVEAHKPMTGEGKKYPYSFVLEGRCHNHMSETIEEAMLDWIGTKHEGWNSQFSGYAWRSLDRD